MFQQCYDWYVAGTPLQSPEGPVSQTRDVFNARLGHFLGEVTKAGMGEKDATLLSAAVGEIGNNCFDHNLGQWRDIPGCWFGHEKASNALRVWIADRGVGILRTLGRAHKEITNEQQAIEAAFEKTISGRYPEMRGNGLKFVRQIINGNLSRGLVCVSGTAAFACGGNTGEIEKIRGELSRGVGVGTLTVITWGIAS